MLNKITESAAEAISNINDGATILIGGFGLAGQPAELIDALIERNAKDLTIVNNNAGNGDTGLAALLKAGCVRKIICSFPRQHDSYIFDDLYRAGKIELEVVPQGTLAARIQAGGSGLVRFIPRQLMEPCLLKVKRRAPLMVSTMYWNILSKAILRSLKH